MTYVLGINDGHSSTASLLQDGQIVTCVSEERFTRKKNEFGFPKKAIEYSLSHAGITGDQLDMIVIAWKNPFQLSLYNTASNGNSSATFDLLGRAQEWYLRKVCNRWPNAAFLYERARKTYESTWFDKYNKKRLEIVSKEIGIDTKKIFLADHHTCHAYTAYFASGMTKEPTLVFTMDGEGDNACATVSTITNGEIKFLAVTPRWRSIGDLYQEVTRYLGMKPLEHEYKVMGLAPYASPDATDKAYKIMKELITLQDDLTFTSSVSSLALRPYLSKILAYQRFDGIAGAVQKLVEDRVTEWVRQAVKKTGISRVLFSGGVFLNVKLNMLLSQMEELDNLYFAPSPGDESNAMGAAYLGYYMLGHKDMKPLKQLYLGPSFTNDDVKQALQKKECFSRFKVEYYDDIDGVVADLLAKNKIVARMNGRMEWGARALGNRSINCNPSQPDLVKVLNDAIKMRDFWMPFAPSILKKREHDYIINPKKIPAPYMILAFDSKSLGQKDLPAAMHPYDFTLRPQVVEDGWNDRYQRIISEFEGRTGIGGVLNTSFNLHGEPVVCAPEDAIHTFEESALPFVAMENYLLRKMDA